MRAIQRVQPGGVHRFPEDLLFHVQIKKPDREIAGEVNLRPLFQFPWFSGAYSASSRCAAAPVGEIARNTMPMISSFVSMA